MTNYDILKEYEAHQTPVPSYDEWEQLQNWSDFTNDYHELREKLEIAEYENTELKEQINKYYLDAINRGTANAVKAVKEFGMPERIKELVEQNAQLKDLLKECFEYIDWTDGTGSPISQQELLDKINEALK